MAQGPFQVGLRRCKPGFWTSTLNFLFFLIMTNSCAPQVVSSKGTVGMCHLISEQGLHSFPEPDMSTDQHLQWLAPQ